MSLHKPKYPHSHSVNPTPPHSLTCHSTIPPHPSHVTPLHLHTPHMSVHYTSTPLTCPSSSLNLTSRLTSTGSRSFSARSAILLCCSTFCSVCLRSSWYCTPSRQTDRQTDRHMYTHMSTHVQSCPVCSLLYHTKGDLFAVIAFTYKCMYMYVSVLWGLPWQHAINKQW